VIRFPRLARRLLSRNQQAEEPRQVSPAETAKRLLCTTAQIPGPTGPAMPC
jgi:hypothetical protein